MDTMRSRRGVEAAGQGEAEALPRRALLRGGLGAFAAAMMSRALPACGGDGSAAPGDAGLGDAGVGDAGLADAGMGDAGVVGDPPFVPREMPPAPRLVSRIADIGPLRAPNELGLRLPEGFTARVIGRSTEPVMPGGYEWHQWPDGGATYAMPDGGWVLVSNSEVPRIPPALKGGVGAVRFAADGRIVGAYRILDDTSVNCAGCKTPWGSWLSCEEISRGKVYECDPWGERAAVVRPALGVFKHEAAAVDPVNAHVYLTEDETDGRFYRFVPARRTPQGTPTSPSGVLEVAEVDGESVVWRPVPDPQFTGDTPTRMQVEKSTRFDGGEGIWYHAGVVYFSTKGDNRVWAYNVAASRLTVLYDAARHAMPPLRGVDNLTVSCCGDVLVAEDGGTMQVVAILPSGAVKPLVQIVGHDGSEVCGPAFDPSGTRLYFSSQRGPMGGVGGITYEVTGPFHAPMP
jgi:hypothetical protein